MTRAEVLPLAKPMLFNTAMVQALLQNRKTATRRLPRLLDKRSEVDFQDGHLWEFLEIEGQQGRCKIEPPHKVGDYIYVRETWCNIHKPEFEPEYYYLADVKFVEDYDPFEWIWRPSTQMPKAAARIFLKVTGVRAEQLREITPEQIVSEGIGLIIMPKHQLCWWFANIWDRMMIKAENSARHSWNANPWVWVIEFERVLIDEM